MNRRDRDDLKKMTTEQLTAQLQEAERDLLNFRFDAGMNRLTNPAGMHNARKRIAVVKTLIREKELLAESGFATMEEYKAYKSAERKAYHASKAR